MPSGETYVFAEGVLTEIKEASSGDDEPDEELQEENARLKAENEELKQNLSDVQASIKGIQTEILNLKKSVGSTFNYTGKQKPKDEPHEEKTSRKLFKDEK